jgi:hypothetical protein
LLSQDSTSVNFDAILSRSSTDSDYPSVDLCPAPIIANISVLRYKTFSKVFVEIKGDVAKQEVTLMSSRGAIAGIQELNSAGTLVFDQLKTDETYALQFYNLCGEVLDPIVVETKMEDQELYKMSEPLYNHIVAYLKEPKGQNFTDYLNRIADVSMPQKMAFAQHLFYKGQPFEDDMADSETFPNRVGNPESDTCFCSALISVPAVSTGDLDVITGKVISYEQPNGGVTTNIGGDPNTRQWGWYRNKGAAKWHNLFTEGFKSIPGQDYEITKSWVDSTLDVDQQTLIRSVLFCLNGDLVPRECECAKPIRFWYGYNTTVKTVAERRDNVGNWSRNSIAAAEDMALVTFREEFNVNSFELVNHSLARVASRCDRTLNANFWSTVAKLAGSATDLSLHILGASADSTLSSQEANTLSQKFDDYFNNWATMFNTPYFDASNCLADNTVTAGLASQTAELQRTLSPNKPVRMAITSFTNLKAGGRRGWHSYARINSNAWILASIKSDRYSGLIPLHCCTPFAASWVVGSETGPLTTLQMQKRVGDLLYGEGYFNYGTIGGQTPKEWGWASRPSNDRGCDKIVVNPNGGHYENPFQEPGDRTAETTAPITDWVNLTIFDLSGREIKQIINTEGMPLNSNTVVDMPSGVYLGRYTNASGAYKHVKIYINQ